MTITSHHRLPAQPTRPAGTDAAALRAGVYQEFLYGVGAAPGLDLGRALRYTKDGGVFRQEFELGLTLANAGDVPVEVVLDRAYDDAEGARRTRLTLFPHCAEVLRLPA